VYPYLQPHRFTHQNKPKNIEIDPELKEANASIEWMPVWDSGGLTFGQGS